MNNIKKKKIYIYIYGFTTGQKVNLQEIIKTFPMLFDDRLRLVCKANMQQASLAICRDSNDGSLWILNDEVQNCELKARELFGFNIGSFQELPTGDLCTICFPTQKKCVRI